MVSVLGGAAATVIVEAPWAVLTWTSEKVNVTLLPGWIVPSPFGVTANRTMVGSLLPWSMPMPHCESDDTPVGEALPARSRRPRDPASG